jgi:hypothetical protein
MNKIYIVVIAVVLCCLILIIGIAFYFFNKKKINSSQINPNDTIPMTTDPIPMATDPIPKEIDKKTQINNLGQILQKDELEISSKMILFAVTPLEIIKTNPVSYTISFDCYIESLAPTWRNIFNNGLNDYGDSSCRVPAVFITGEDAKPANRLHIVHGANEDFNLNIISKFTAPLKEWFNITFVVDNKKLSSYFNSIEDDSVSGTFNWGTVPPNNWKWNQYFEKAPRDIFGSVKVKNVVFWNIPLVKSQIDIISKQ